MLQPAYTDIAMTHDEQVEIMAAAGAERTWRDLCPIGDPARAWAKCPPEARERWRSVARAMATALERRDVRPGLDGACEDGRCRSANRGRSMDTAPKDGRPVPVYGTLLGSEHEGE
jgi:hypothetical protein